MALQHDGGAYTLNGKPADDAAVVAFRDAQIDAWADELGQIAIDELGDSKVASMPWYEANEDHVLVDTGNRIRISAIEFPLSRIEAFGARFLRRVSEIVTSAYVWARGGVEVVTDQGWGTVASLIARQDAYGKGFIDALKRGELSPVQAANRARMYSGAATGAFEAGKTDQVGFDAPVQPGDSCEGLSACRCYWQIEEFPDRIEGTWIAVGDKDTCPWCAGNADEYAPLVQRKS